jgi:hypothetical protein
VRHDTKRAAENISFFDDRRVHGPAGGLTHTALHKACTGLQYLGNQIALQNHRFLSSRSSAWNGGCVKTDQMLPRKFLSQIKWDRLKNDIRSVKAYAAKTRIRLEKKYYRSEVSWFMLQLIMILCQHI